MNAMTVRTPWHLWAVGALALVWNGYGGFDYVMTQTQNAAYLAQFTEAQRAYFESFPMWMEAVWAIGVWGGRAGLDPAAAAQQVGLSGLSGILDRLRHQRRVRPDVGRE